MGALVWSFHRRIAVERSDGTRRASALVMSGVGLVGVASGVGIVVNATLAALASPLAASDDRSLLLGGISALVVGGPVWWLSWKPTRRVDLDGDRPRRSPGVPRRSVRRERRGGADRPARGRLPDLRVLPRPRHGREPGRARARAVRPPLRHGARVRLPLRRLAARPVGDRRRGPRSGASDRPRHPRDRRRPRGVRAGDREGHGRARQRLATLGGWGSLRVRMPRRSPARSRA